jgi:RNA polymerase sigma-70 factor (ECF subfamily)
MAKLIPIRRVDGAVSDMSDEALVAACATGDRAALGALFDRHHAAVRSFAARMLGTDAAELDDVVQLTFETVQGTAPKFGGRSAVRTWIVGIARNVVRHQIRKRARTDRVTLALIAEPTPKAATPLEHVAERDQMRRLSEAIATLSPKLREVFLLVYVEGMTGREVASALGLREGTVWKRLYLARQRLRDVLGGSP